MLSHIHHLLFSFKSTFVWLGLLFISEIRETCALFDTDNTGKLSRDDIANVVRSNPTEKELLDMFQSIDADGMESKY